MKTEYRLRCVPVPMKSMKSSVSTVIVQEKTSVFLNVSYPMTIMLEGVSEAVNKFVESFKKSMQTITKMLSGMSPEDMLKAISEVENNGDD